MQSFLTQVTALYSGGKQFYFGWLLHLKLGRKKNQQQKIDTFLIRRNFEQLGRKIHVTNIRI